MLQVNTLIKAMLTVWIIFAIPCYSVEINQMSKVVNIKQFKHLVKDGDWSPAIQSAIDFVSKENGFDVGGTIFFPAGTYRIDHSIIVGRNPAHWGLHLIGYGATLVGSKILDTQPEGDPELGKTWKCGNLTLNNPSKEEKGKGIPILILKNPPGIEGAGYCIEGLRFTRENTRHGTAIFIPWRSCPKCTSFRNIKIHGQKVGIHIISAWQLYFSDCIFRGNEIGVIAQNNGNALGFVNCVFRRNHKHGLVIGPDRGSWGSNGHSITGCIFESNKGYGIKLISAGQTFIAGNYFEANGNDIGVLTPWNVTIDTNLFWGSYGHGWRMTPYANDAHIVVNRCQDLRLRNNHYATVDIWFRQKLGKKNSPWEYVPHNKAPKGKSPQIKDGYKYVKYPGNVLIVGTFSGRHLFDTVPTVLPGAKIEQTLIGSDTGLYYYRYNPPKNIFEQQSLIPGMEKGK